MYERKMPLKKRSGIDVTFYVIGGKWKRDIISCLHKGIKRPSELQKHLAQVSASARVLRQQLKELETFGIIYKKVYPVVPLKVEYFLTDIGLQLIPLFSEMEDWGTKYEDTNKVLENGHVIFSPSPVIVNSQN
jgi:DNA-binding HxlR family transcriptional regulator